MVGTVQNKEKFLANVAKSLGREPRKSGVERPKWKHSPQWDVFKGYSQEQLVDQLKNQCERIHTRYEVTTVDNLPAMIEQVLASFNVNSIVNWGDPRFDEYKLTGFFDKLSGEGKDVHVWNSELGEENVEIAEKADVGITFSDMTLAESGTVVLMSDKGKGRSVSLLPTGYIAIIPKSTIVPRMTQATHEFHKLAEKAGYFPSCINFISGPSNSADIEMNLVVGVHGPVRACYIVVEDK
ncbi:LutC/YkgG family protein [Bacillus sp. FJAT-45350]|uniref:LutC/YkgG family protein n=1 Tax=Bacillus sp. FJAT-45350 TaxID=2011014 RepID=UPI000BB7D7DD|nr:lactate utilization protein C [Bacillus sp. FJAT-45350]